MDVNEEFAANLACVRCGRAVRNNSKWLRLTEGENGLNFFYRCAKCHSVFRGVATKQMLAKLEALAQLDMSTVTGANITEANVTRTPRPAKQPGKRARPKISRPRFFRNRRTRKEMERYAGTFEKELFADGNDFLSQVIMSEGNNWRSQSD